MTYEAMIENKFFVTNHVLIRVCAEYGIWNSQLTSRLLLTCYDPRNTTCCLETANVNKSRSEELSASADAFAVVLN